MDEQDRDRDAPGEDTEGHGIVKTIGLPPPRESGEPGDDDTEGHRNLLRADDDDAADVEGHGSRTLLRADEEDEDTEGHRSLIR